MVKNSQKWFLTNKKKKVQTGQKYGSLISDCSSPLTPFLQNTNAKKYLEILYATFWQILIKTEPQTHTAQRIWVFKKFFLKKHKPAIII